MKCAKCFGMLVFLKMYYNLHLNVLEALAGEHLIANKDVDFVILTGGEDTASFYAKNKTNLFQLLKLVEKMQQL